MKYYTVLKDLLIKWNFWVVLLFLLPAVVCSQDFDEWKQEREREFQEFQDERDIAFLKMLEESWQAIDSMDPFTEFEEPKISEVPVADQPYVREPDATRNQVDSPAESEIPADEDEFIHEEFEPLSLSIPEVPSGAQLSSINFFDSDVEYYYFPAQSIRLSGLPNQDNLRQFWQDMSASDYDIYLNRLSFAIDQMNLNDWGALKLINQLGEAKYGGPGNHANLFIWFMMTKLGFDLRVGYNNSNVYVLFASDYRITGTRFFIIDGKRYYYLSVNSQKSKPGRLTTYQGSYPNAERFFDLDITLLPELTERLEFRELTFFWQGEEFNVSIPFNTNIIQFYRHFPNTEFQVYTMASISEATLQSFQSELGSIIEGKSQAEAAEILLRFVQTAFDYKTDTEQFGRQKFMLPEEILYYPYSDCDDRTILYAFLAHNLLDLEVVALRYPGHLATAILLDEEISGDSVQFQGEQYIVADPTYINASVGMTMPKFRGVSPNIIALF